MSNEIEAVTEGARAVQEVAKTTGKALDAAQAGGVYLARMLGTAPEDVVGLLGGDLLRQYRIRNWHRISQKTFDKLDHRGVEQVEPLSAKVIVPLLEAASNESDETLQDMWAALLANAMDPNKDTSLQRVFIETLKQFEPLDVLVFKLVVQDYRPESRSDLPGIANTLNLRRTAVTVSAQHLQALRCIKGGGSPVPTALGIELLNAVSPDAPD